MSAPSAPAPAATPATAMILAAGLGTRMRELTADRPKPMLPVAGRPLLDHALDRAAEGGAARAVVNVHYFADQIRAHLRGRAAAPAVTISDETDALLETGGGLVRALPLLGKAPVYVMNSDALWTGPAPLPVLAGAWDGGRMDALLLMVARADARAYTRQGDFFLTADMRPERRGDRASAPYVYTGAQILSPALIAEFEEERFSANAIWDRALERGRLFACVHAGGWVDVGTPEGLAEADRLVREDEA